MKAPTELVVYYAQCENVLLKGARKITRSLITLAAAVLLLATLSAATVAQSDNGNIKGYVIDQSGAALPGVAITITGPTLMGKRTATTDEQGYYRILDLPPGQYELTAELANFARIHRPGLVVRAGLTVGLDLVMTVGSISEVIEVRADAPLLESEKAERTFNIDGNFIRDLPLTAGHNWWDALKLVPGVLILGGEGGTLETHGSGLSSNVFLMDGFDISDVQQNAAGGTQIPLDSVSDIKITTSGHDAASRMAVGAQLGIVTKSGGNDTHGSLTADLQPKRLNDTNIPGGSPADRTIYQYSGSIGGPIVKDRLWYFGSYRYIREVNGIARKESDIATLKLFDPNFAPFDRILPTHQLLTKATLQLTQSDRITFSYQYNRTIIQNNANDPTWTRERALNQFSGGPLYGLSLWHNFGSRATLELQGSYFSKPFDVRDQGTGPETRIYNATILSGGRLNPSGPAIVQMGNVQSFNRSEQRRGNVNINFSYLISNLWGNHELKAGSSMLPKTYYTFINTSANDGYVLEERVLLNPANPAAGSRPFHRRYEDPIKIEGVGKKSRSWGLYLQDSWRPHRRWVLNFGVRLDKVQTYDTWGDPIQSSWQGGPRIGVAYRITEDGKNIIRGSFNRMYDAINNLFAFSEGSLRKGARDEYDIDGNGTFETIFTTPAVLTRPAPATNANRGLVSPDLKQPRTDEFTVSYSRQLPWKMVLDTTFIHRDYKDKIVGVDINGIYENGQFLGYRDPNFNQIFEVRNGSENWLVYRAIEISLHKNLSNNLQFLTGYSLADLRIDGTWDINDPASFLQPDAFPNSKGVGRTVNPANGQINSLNQASYANTGTPPHNFKMHATYVAPFGITIGASHLYQMGQYSGPIFTLIPASQVPHPATVRLSNGRTVSNPLATRTRFFHRTRDEGQFTAPSLNVLNLRVGKRFKLEKHGFEAAVQIFNLFNQGEDLFFNTPVLVEGQPSTITRRLTQAPRAGQITLRWEF